METLRALPPLAFLLLAGCGDGPRQPEFPPPDPPSTLETSGTEAPAPAPVAAAPVAVSPVPTPTPTRQCASGTFTIDPNTRMEIPGHGPYLGAMAFDLTAVQTAPRATESVTFPSVWAEPADPELAFRHLRITDPSDLAGQGSVPRERIRAGSVFSVAADSGRTYRVEILAFTGGNRATASMQIRIAETGCAP